jgi:hypothetical protein
MAINRPEAPPTTRQIYALAGELCERMGETFPKSRGEASETIERLRIENGHPAPRLEDSPRAERRRGPKKFERSVAREVVRQLRDDDL